MKTKEEMETLIQNYRTRLKQLESEYNMALGAISALEWAQKEQEEKEATKNEKDKPKDTKKA